MVCFCFHFGVAKCFLRKEKQVCVVTGKVGSAEAVDTDCLNKVGNRFSG